MKANNYNLKYNSKTSLRKPERSQRRLWGYLFNQSPGRRLRDLQIGPLWGICETLTSQRFIWELFFYFFIVSFCFLFCNFFSIFLLSLWVDDAIQEEGIPFDRYILICFPGFCELKRYVNTLAYLQFPKCNLVISTAKNTVISPDFPVWKFCGKAEFSHSFGFIEVSFLIWPLYKFKIKPKIFWIIK